MYTILKVGYGIDTFMDRSSLVHGGSNEQDMLWQVNSAPVGEFEQSPGMRAVHGQEHLRSEDGISRGGVTWAGDTPGVVLLPGRYICSTAALPLPSSPCAVVVVLSRDYMAKKWPMRELEHALQRRKKDPSSITLLPVLMDDLTIEDLKDLYHRVYDHESIWKIDRPRPSPETLDKWAGLAAQLTGITSRVISEVRLHFRPHTRCAAATAGFAAEKLGLHVCLGLEGGGSVVMHTVFCILFRVPVRTACGLLSWRSMLAGAIPQPLSRRCAVLAERLARRVG